ncbi:MAG: beta-lactamase family protein [Armatimonadetes bacterium]|nr:beta-lactamase family protein [Armatimonadota bacterium]
MNLDRLFAKMESHVVSGEVPGIVALVSHGDSVHQMAFGNVELDTIFRIASITKPVTAAAGMILVDDGKIGLDDSVEPWLPELANRQVLRDIGSELNDTVHANRPITFRDLQTFTFGFGSVMAMPDTYPIQKPIAEGNLGGDGPPRLSRAPGQDEFMRRLGALPLMHQPGERWLYNTGSDVLGILISRVSGMSLQDFMRERLFQPLGMADTGFSVPESKHHRLPALLWPNEGGLQVFDAAGSSSEIATPPAFQSGSGGLVSTASDYLSFCRMLLRKGQGVLSESSISMMMSDRLVPSQRIGGEIFFGDHSSWGFGGAICIGGEEPWQVPGRYGWDGGFGTSAYSDPSNDLCGVLMTQRMMTSPETPKVFTDFWRCVYEGL